MRILKPYTSNTSLITSCSRCHHSEFLHSDSTGGPCWFSECKCPRFAPKPQPKASQEPDGELRS
jgi:cytochrome c553